ncbi:hypothetical protein ANCCEY_14651 [Ancylostoma ceylanicum]|uniref:Uncharacterized protein n=1 Tax=Ancylostoma ceylanicum TaxID=53326 RepID=A0A0D6L644_9BILA|nr:hypothetical protein ANCCEY_14651 [Ancylostoma ceylanicum]
MPVYKPFGRISHPTAEHRMRNEEEHAIKCLEQTQYAEDALCAAESEKTQVAHEDGRQEESATERGEKSIHILINKDILGAQKLLSYPYGMY